jgi:GT2 family glycosyltransferase
MGDPGIVIITYFSGPEIGPCLDAAMASGAEIIVVDNGSTDGTLEEVSRRGVRLIANRRNQGFAAAANQGFAALNTPYILLLNPDAVIAEGLKELQLACSISGAAGAGGRLLNHDGSPQIGFMVRRLPSPASALR